MRIFGYIMAVLYVIIGILLVIGMAFTYLPEYLRIMFGVFFAVYGIFRFVRIYYSTKENKTYNNNEENSNEQI